MEIVGKYHINENLSGTTIVTISPILNDADDDSEQWKDLDDIYTLERLFICNTDSTNIYVNLFQQITDHSTGTAVHTTYNYLKDCLIPKGVTLDFNNGIPLEIKRSSALQIQLTDAAYTGTVNGLITLKQKQKQTQNDKKQRTFRRK